MTQIYEMTQIIPVHVQKEQVIFEYTIMLILLCMCIITVSLINFIICIIVMRNIVEIKIQQINKQILSIQEEHQETIEQINKQILSIHEQEEHQETIEQINKQILSIQEEHQEHQEQQQKKITNIELQLKQMFQLFKTCEHKTDVLHANICKIEHKNKKMFLDIYVLCSRYLSPNEQFFRSIQNNPVNTYNCQYDGTYNPSYGATGCTMAIIKGMFNTIFKHLDISNYTGITTLTSEEIDEIITY